MSNLPSIQSALPSSCTRLHELFIQTPEVKEILTSLARDNRAEKRKPKLVAGRETEGMEIEGTTPELAGIITKRKLFTWILEVKISSSGCDIP